MYIRWNNRQRAVSVEREKIVRHLPGALLLCEEQHGTAASVLSSLEGVSISLLSGKEISRVHEEFCGVPGPTDVITFPYGEILIGAPVIRDQAGDFGHPVEREALLCSIHGILHLHGYDDLDANNRSAMHQLQEKILQALWPRA